MATGNIVSILVELKDLASAGLKQIDQNFDKFGKSAVGDVGDINKELSKLGDSGSKSLKKIDKEFENLKKTSSKGLFGFAISTKELVKFGQELKSVGDNISSIGRSAAVFGAGITAMFATPAIAAANFQTSLAKVDTLLTDGSAKITDYSNVILQLSQNYGKSASEVSQALYQIVSAQVQGVDSAKLLEISLNASIAGQSSLADAADITAKILNTWGGDAKRANEISDILFKTVELGVTNFQQLSQNLRGSLPLAQQLGISFEEVSAAMTVLTKTLDTAASEVALKGLFNALIQSSDKFLERGIDITKVVSEQGLVGALKALEEVTQGDTIALKQFIPESRALTAVLGLLNNNAEVYNKNFKLIQESTGATDVAFEKMSKTAEFAFSKLTATLKALFISIGTDLLPTLTGAIESISNFILYITKSFNNLGEWKNYILLGVGALGGLAVVLGTLTAALGLFISGIGQVITILPTFLLIVGNLTTGLTTFGLLIGGKILAGLTLLKTAFATLMSSTVVTSIVSGLTAIKTGLLSTAAAASPLAIALGVLLAAFAGFKIGEYIRDFELLGYSLTDLFTVVINYGHKSLAALELAFQKAGLAYAQWFGNDKDVAIWERRIQQTKNYQESLDALSVKTTRLKSTTDKQAESFNTSDNAIYNNIESTKTLIDAITDATSNIDSENSELQAQSKILDDLYTKLIQNLEAQKQAFLNDDNLEAATKVQEQITQAQEEQQKQRLTSTKENSKKEIDIISNTSQTVKKIREEEFKRNQQLADAHLNTAKANAELEKTIQADLFAKNKISAEEYSTFRIEKLNEEYQATVDSKQKELEFLLSNNENLNAQQINQSKILQEEIKQLEIQHQTQLIQLQTELGQQKYDAWKQQEDRKLETLKQNFEVEKELDNLAIQEGEITQAEAIDNEIAREQEFYDEKYNLATENLNKLSGIYGIDSQQYAQALSEKEGLEAQHNLKIQQLHIQSEQAQLDTERQFDSKAEQENSSSLQRRVQEYQMAAKIFSTDFKERMSSVFGEILGRSIDTTKLHMARYSDIFGLELEKLEYLVYESRQKLSQQGIDLTQSTSAEAKNLLQDLTGQFTNNMGELTQRFIAYYDRVKGLLNDLQGEVESYEDELLRLQGDQVAIVENERQKELDALQSKYSEDLQNTEEYRKAKELIEKIYNEKRKNAEEQMYNELENRQKQYEESTKTTFLGDNTQTQEVTSIETGLRTVSGGTNVDKSGASGSGTIAMGLANWGRGYVEAVQLANTELTNAVGNVVGLAPVEQDINVNKNVNLTMTTDVISGNPLETERYVKEQVMPIIKREIDLGGGSL